MTDVRVVPRSPSLGWSLSLHQMTAQSAWSGPVDNTSQDPTPPTLIPALGAPMLPKLTPTTSSSSLSSWDANTTQAAYALTEMSQCHHSKPTYHVCPTIPEVISNENTEHNPDGAIHMDITSDSSMPTRKSFLNHPITISSCTSLSLLDEAATLIQLSSHLQPYLMMMSSVLWIPSNMIPIMTQSKHG